MKHLNKPETTAMLATLSLVLALPFVNAKERKQSPDAAPDSKPRTVVLTDIGGDPDDAMSVVRLLLYANELDIEGLYAGPGSVNPGLIFERIEAYGKVLPNLKLHAGGYPEVEALRATVKADTRKRGMQAIGAGKDTPASRHLIEVVDRNDARPVWVQIWGAGGALAQALWDVRAERSPEEVARFVSKLRVYDIGGQDETGAWALHEFPDIKWLRSENMFFAFAPYPEHKLKRVWDNFLHLELAHGGKVKAPEELTGPDVEELIGDAWVDRHVQSGHGPLGELYSERSWAYEGDTPALLYLLPNGLSDPEKQWYGGWGGRFSKQFKKNPRCFQQRRNEWQKPFEPFFAYTGASDEWTSADGRVWKSQFASLFRWRRAFQNDFQARMDWCVKPYEEANHPPRPVVNGDDSVAPVYVKTEPGAVIELDASESSDPDGDRLNFHWIVYEEVSDLKGVEISGADTANAVVKIPIAAAGRVHVILVCTDAGNPPLTRYRRFIASVGAEN